MSNWKLINKTYLYDGTFYGLLTIVFDSYIHKTLPQKIYNKDTYIYNLYVFYSGTPYHPS